MVSLEIAGKLKDAGSFPDKLPENYPLKFKAYQYDSMLFALENFKLAKKYGRTEIAKLISREIRLGKLDQLTEGKNRLYILSEAAHYFYHKMLRRLKGVKY